MQSYPNPNNDDNHEVDDDHGDISGVQRQGGAGSCSGGEATSTGSCSTHKVTWLCFGAHEAGSQFSLPDKTDLLCRLIFWQFGFDLRIRGRFTWVEVLTAVL